MLRNKLGQFVKGFIPWNKNRIKKICQICGKEFETCPSYNCKYCSRKCYGISKIGKPSWNKGLPMWWDNGGGFKKGHAPWNWKGDNIGYGSLHRWVSYHKGKPQICEHCGTTTKERKLHWANKDHLYRRNLDDYIALCVPCHSKYDFLKNNLLNH